jgi:molybdopterin-guanine dinucleotide biosynthesis protein A
MTRIDAAVILAGGASRRMDGVDKLLELVRGVPLLQHVLQSCQQAGVADPIVVGPARPGIAATYLQEDPPVGGPAAGLAAGLLRAGPGLVLVLAGDQPNLTADLLVALAAEVGEVGDPGKAGNVGAIAVDGQGREQWLLGAHRDLIVPVDCAGLAVRRLLDRPGLRRLAVPDRQTWDCDTPQDLQRAREDPWTPNAG